MSAKMMATDLRASGYSAEHAELLSGISPGHAEMLAVIDPATKAWLLGLLSKFGSALMPALIAALPAFAKGDYKAAIEIILETLFAQIAPAKMAMAECPCDPPTPKSEDCTPSCPPADDTKPGPCPETHGEGPCPPAPPAQT